jgi:hypothetical protein
MTNQSKPFIHVGGTSHFDFVMSCCGFFFSAGGDVPRVASTAEAVKEVWWLDSSGVAAHLDSSMSLWTSFFLGGVFFFGGVVVSVGRNFMKMPWARFGEGICEYGFHHIASGSLLGFGWSLRNIEVVLCHVLVRGWTRHVDNLVPILGAGCQR